MYLFPLFKRYFSSDMFILAHNTTGRLADDDPLMQVIVMNIWSEANICLT